MGSEEGQPSAYEQGDERRWDCSLDDLAGWAINGKPEVVMAIEPIQQNGTILSGLVVVPVVDILSMFRRWASGPQRRVIRRVRPIGQKDWVMIADPKITSPSNPPTC